MVSYFPHDPPSKASLVGTDDAQAKSTFSVRVKSKTGNLLISGLQWAGDAVTAGATVKAVAIGKDTGTIYGESASALAINGILDLPFSSPVTLTPTEEIYFCVEQTGTARYMYKTIFFSTITSDQIAWFTSPGCWAYDFAPAAVALWNADGGQRTDTDYGINLIIGIPSSLSATASHTPSSASIGNTVSLSVEVSGATGTPTYAWAQTAGPSTSITNPTSAAASVSPTIAGTYTFECTVTDDTGSVTASTTVVITAAPDTTAPSVPTNLVPSDITKTAFTVTCDASTDNVAVTQYRWYVDGVLYGAPTSTPVKTFVGRTPGTDYSITVQAGDAVPNWSASSAAKIVTTLANSGGGAAPVGELYIKTTDSGGVEHLVRIISALPDPEYVFRPESYGAKGDGLALLGTVHTTAGSPNITATDAQWTVDDIGKTIMISSTDSAGTSAQIPSIGTIVSVADATHATMSVNAVRTQTNASAFYATDDSQAFLDVTLAMRDYLRDARDPHVVLQLSKKFYGLASVPTADTDGAIGTWSRAQVPLPVNPTIYGRKWVIEIQGPGIDGATFTSWHQEVPQMSGTMLVSMINVNSGMTVAGFPISVVGGTPTYPSSWEIESNEFNNTLVVLDGFRIMCPFNPGQIAIDLVHEGQYDIGTLTADIFSSPKGLTGGHMISTNQDGMGFRTNYTGYNDRSTIDALYIQGYYTGAMVDEHCQWDNVTVIYSHFGLYISIPSGGTVQHGAVIDYASIEVSDYPLFVATGASSDPTPVAYFGLVIQMLDNEDSVIEHIHDPGNVLFGTVNIFASGSSSTPQDAIVAGAGNLTINVLSGGTKVAAP